MKRSRLILFGSVFLLACVCSAQALTTIPDSALTPSTAYYTDGIGGGIGSSSIMAPNDDGSSAQQNLGFTLTFFGTDYTTFWVNNNGNVTFTGSLSTFTPQGPTGVNVPIISPFFADVDTRNPDSGLVYLRNDIANEIIVTWDQVGYFGEHADKLDSFQLVLRGPDYNVPFGEGRIGFFYKTMQWETGDASGGSGGFGGFPAAVGFGDGQGNGEVLEGSQANGISGIVSDHYIWFDINLAPIVTAPEPTSLLLIGLGLVGLAGARRFRFRKHA